MAELVGLLASVGQLLHYSALIVTSLKAFYEGVQNAPERFQQRSDQIQHLVDTLKLIQETALLNTNIIAKHLESILQSVQRLESRLKKALKHTSGKSRKRYWKAIWATDKELEISREFVILEEKKSSLGLCILGTYGEVMSPASKTTGDAMEGIENTAGNSNNNGQGGRLHATTAPWTTEATTGSEMVVRQPTPTSPRNTPLPSYQSAQPDSSSTHNRQPYITANHFGQDYTAPVSVPTPPQSNAPDLPNRSGHSYGPISVKSGKSRSMFGNVGPTDPQTHASHEYQKIDIDGGDSGDHDLHYGNGDNEFAKAFYNREGTRK